MCVAAPAVLSEKSAVRAQQGLSEHKKRDRERVWEPCPSCIPCESEVPLQRQGYSSRNERPQYSACFRTASTAVRRCWFCAAAAAHNSRWTFALASGSLFAIHSLPFRLFSSDRLSHSLPDKIHSHDNCEDSCVTGCYCSAGWQNRSVPMLRQRDHRIVFHKACTCNPS